MYIDIPKIKDYFRLSDKQIKELLVILMSNMNNDWELLELSINSKDMENINKLAHKMKSSFSYFLIDHFKNQFQKIEDLSKKQDWDLLLKTWDKIKIDKLHLSKEISLLLD